MSNDTAGERIAIIRRGFYDHPRFPGWIAANGFEVVDAWSRDQVSLETITDGGVVTCIIHGVPLAEMKHVIFLGNPWDVRRGQESERDVAYRSSETSAALLAALWLLPQGVVLSPGSVFGFNRVLGESEFLRYKLRDAGWALSSRTFASSWEDLGDAKVEGAPPPPAVDRPVLHVPEVDDSEKVVLVVGRALGMFRMDAPEKELPAELARLAAQTCSLLGELELEFATIATGLVNGRYYAYGARAGLPFHTPHALATRLVGASMGRHRSARNEQDLEVQSCFF